MPAMGVYDQVKKAFQEMLSMKAELISEIRRVDNRIDSVEREVRTAIDIRERLVALEARRPA